MLTATKVKIPSTLLNKATAEDFLYSAIQIATENVQALTLQEYNMMVEDIHKVNEHRITSSLPEYMSGIVNEASDDNRNHSGRDISDDEIDSACAKHRRGDRI